MGYRRAADVWFSPEAYSALLLLREAAIETRSSMRGPQIPLFLPYVLEWGSIEKTRIGTRYRTGNGSIYLEHRQAKGTGSKPAEGFRKGQGCYIEHLGLLHGQYHCVQRRNSDIYCHRAPFRSNKMSQSIQRAWRCVYCGEAIRGRWQKLEESRPPRSWSHSDSSWKKSQRSKEKE